MPPVKLAYDGLWQCLCPSFRAALSRKPLSYSKADTANHIRFAHNETHQVLHRHSSALQADSQHCYLERSRQTGFFSARPGTRLAHGRADVGLPVNLAKLSTNDAYEELRRASVHGDALHVQALVDLLVGTSNQTRDYTKPFCLLTPTFIMDLLPK